MNCGDHRLSVIGLPSPKGEHSADSKLELSGPQYRHRLGSMEFLNLRLAARSGRHKPRSAASRRNYFSLIPVTLWLGHNEVLLPSYTLDEALGALTYFPQTVARMSRPFPRTVSATASK